MGLLGDEPGRAPLEYSPPLRLVGSVDELTSRPVAETSAVPEGRGCQPFEGDGCLPNSLAASEAGTRAGMNRSTLDDKPLCDPALTWPLALSGEECLGFQGFSRCAWQDSNLRPAD
jgi:hypothetical protein